MRQIVFLLEEPSAKALLQGLLPRILPGNWVPLFIVFQGKQDLEKGMVTKLRHWKTPGTLFVVLRDQDSEDCMEVKAGLLKRCQKAGKPSTLVRVACRELEAWVLGDLESFATEFDCPSANQAKKKSKLANPDNTMKPVKELRRFFPAYQKVDGARRMGQRLDPQNNKSASFRAFCAGVERITQTG